MEETVVDGRRWSLYIRLQKISDLELNCMNYQHLVVMSRLHSKKSQLQDTVWCQKGKIQFYKGISRPASFHLASPLHTRKPAVSACGKAFHLSLQGFGPGRDAAS